MSQTQECPSLTSCMPVGVAGDTDQIHGLKQTKGCFLQSPFACDFASRSVGAKRIALKDDGGPAAMGERWGWEKTVLWPVMDAQELPGREQGIEQMGEKSPSLQDRLKA